MKNYTAQVIEGVKVLTSTRTGKRMLVLPVGMNGEQLKEWYRLTGTKTAEPAQPDYDSYMKMLSKALRPFKPE